ncbi:MAG: hypothetical protein KGJ98_12895 [Chloroflexota bacterium]|nr:hypothetical protein [Chloroflexota bacterium]
MRYFLASLIVAASVLVTFAAQPAAAAGTCITGSPLLVPILVSPYASGSFQWSATDCSTISGSWTGNAYGGTFMYTNPGGSSNYSGTWTTTSTGGSFTYAACTYCITFNGTWTTTSSGGTLQYTCFSCGDVIGSWTNFGTTAGSFHYGCSGCTATYGNWNSSVYGGNMTMVCATCATTTVSWSWSSPLATPTPSPSPTPAPLPTPTPSPTPPPSTCVDSVGPGIPAPQGLETGIPGLHAAWYGQSGYPTLCPGHQTTVTFPFLNTGSIGWFMAPGQTVLLGTWDPDPGQDMPSVLGGDGTMGSPSTGWPAYNRPAIQPATYVGPGQVAWFQFTIQAPQTPGAYRLAVRPVVDGVTWLEDYGVFVYVTVR